MARSTSQRVVGVLALAGFLALASTVSTAVQSRPAVTDPGPSPTLGAKPPGLDNRTTVLFDGEQWSGWRKPNGDPSRWEITDDGAVVVRGGHAISDSQFVDCQLHLEFLCPLMADKEGQGRANSGVYLHGRYEVQILDSHGVDPAINTCGAVYSIAAALVNACRPPDHWQTYDIIFRAPRLDETGAVIEPAYLTVLHNGILIQNHQAVDHPTTAAIAGDMPARGPLMLQDHGNPVRYRNIWIRTMD